MDPHTIQFPSWVITAVIGLLTALGGGGFAVAILRSALIESLRKVFAERDRVGRLEAEVGEMQIRLDVMGTEFGRALTRLEERLENQGKMLERILQHMNANNGGVA